jgi:hypothetical protein
MVEPSYAQGAYTPTRVALLPPDVFVVLDQVGDNDPAQSAALGQAVTIETVRAIEQSLRARGYDVDLSARWDGIVGRDGSLLVSRDELGWLANGILQFANSPAGGGQGVMEGPRFVAPELAARVGAATQSDALLYVNVKGATTTPGKRTASILAGVFILVVIIGVIALIAMSSKNGGNSGGGGLPGRGGGGGSSVARAPAPSGGWRGSAPAAPASSGGGWRGAPPSAAAGSGGWRGTPPPAPGTGRWVGSGPSSGGGWRGGGAPVYRGGSGVNVGIALVVPLDEPVYTHDGSVAYDDPMFAGDELYVSMTLVSTYDGRILWHARDHLDLEADHSGDVDRMVQLFLGTLPPRAGFAPAPPPRH